MKTKKEIAAMKEHAANIQPEVLKDKSCHPKDIDLYNDMNRIYKELSDKDVSFNLFFTSKNTGLTYCFFRVCVPEERERYQKTVTSSLWRIWDWLYYCSFDKYLEELGIIKILKGRAGKTSEEEFKEIYKKNEKVS